MLSSLVAEVIKVLRVPHRRYRKVVMPLVIFGTIEIFIIPKNCDYLKMRRLLDNEFIYELKTPNVKYTILSPIILTQGTIWFIEKKLIKLHCPQSFITLKYENNHWEFC